MNYIINEELLQGIVSTLGELPSRVSRGLLNAIENTCVEQEKAAAETQKGIDFEAKKKELIEQGWKAPVQKTEEKKA